jgi:opacity protein-like surface antigen
MLSISIGSFSQSYDVSFYRNDISINYGFPSVDMINKVSTSDLDNYFPDNRYLSDNYNGSGVINFVYRRSSRNTKFMWGTSFSYNRFTSDIFYLGTYEGQLNRSFFNWGIEANYKYQNLNKVQLYSGIGVGFRFGNEELTPPIGSEKEGTKGSISQISYQINALGIRFGSSIGGYLELGYGYKGIITAGISYQF